MELNIVRKGGKNRSFARFANCGILVVIVVFLVLLEAMNGAMARTIAFSLGRNVQKKLSRHDHPYQARLLAAKRRQGSDDDSLHDDRRTHVMPHKIGIVGGGLAGLSTAFHLLQKRKSVEITILDKAPVGTAGASSVAGGLVHPLSPRGKLVHGGRQGLDATNKLVKQATRFKPKCVLREELYRVALNEEHVDQLQQTQKAFPDFCTWMSPLEMQYVSKSQYALGGLKLSNGCKVLHVPSYLQGLWMACEELATQNDDDCAAQWNLVDSLSLDDWKERLQEFDTVVLAAGNGLFHDALLQQQDFPVDLIRGQSIEMKVDEQNLIEEALLCGKYISPLPSKNRILIGASHEWKAEPLNQEELVHELKERSYQLAPFVWDGGTIDTITSGFRVQSRRGTFGRSPIIGSLQEEDATSFHLHSNAWIFTGLSSRGLLYHGLYGDILTDAILGNRNDTLWNEYNLDWWRQRTR